MYVFVCSHLVVNTVRLYRSVVSTRVFFTLTFIICSWIFNCQSNRWQTNPRFVIPSIFYVEKLCFFFSNVYAFLLSVPNRWNLYWKPMHVRNFWTGQLIDFLSIFSAIVSTVVKYWEKTRRNLHWKLVHMTTHHHKITPKYYLLLI